ncbi:MAG: hypothetical protein GXC73_16260 [Chitinophagaceae bacterium]|nr:hypothetical protein [Chitinophagaceae bacterium]
MKAVPGSIISFREEVLMSKDQSSSFLILNLIRILDFQRIGLVVVVSAVVLKRVVYISLGI